VSKNQNGVTSLTVSNTTAGTLSFTELTLQQNASAGLAGFGKSSSSSNTVGIITSSNTYLYNGTAGDIAIYNAFSSGNIKFGAGGSSTVHMTLTAAGRLLLGITTESTFLLDVNGTARVSGASTFGGNMALTLNQSSGTLIGITNTNGAGYVEYSLQQSATAGGGVFGKYGHTIAAYKIVTASNTYIVNNTAGDIAILNDFASGAIKFAAGGSSTAHMTIKSNGRVNMSSLPTSATGLSSGDLWNDGGTLKIV
jgi:hypothetical protein